ncbi:McrC family protein [Paenarthrobacter sp. NPDC090517]|uniref:McrC family protein n=1 Tax=Paenarthrobacter sp. NPDC090517 TaxID=3364381 RepID=UPI00382C3ABC
MKRLELTEGSASERAQLPTDIVTTLCRLNVATAVPAGPGEWIISNIRKVGVIRLGDCQIEIKPKIPVSRLFFMMSYSTDPAVWKEQDIVIDRDENLLNTISDAFIRQSARATERGLLQGYETLEDSQPIFRGRLNVDAQIGRRAGLPLPAQVIFDEYTTDIPENRLLLTAAQRLLRVPSLSRLHRTNLRKLVQRLHDVSEFLPGTELPSIQFTRLNSRYRAAIALGTLILQNASLEQRRGEITATAFLFDMWKIFEDFLTTALGEHLRSIGGTVEAQAKGTSLDTAGKISLIPDLLWKDARGVRAIIDAKYKVPKNTSYPNADIYQMLAYCTRFALPAGHLIYAKGEEEPRLHEIIGRSTSIYCHAIDLNLSPGVLLNQVRRLAFKIYRSTWAVP